MCVFVWVVNQMLKIEIKLKIRIGAKSNNNSRGAKPIVEIVAGTSEVPAIANTLFF